MEYSLSLMVAASEISLFCCSRRTLYTDFEMSESLKKPLFVPEKLLMGPGPSNSHPLVLTALSLPVLGHMHPELFQVRDILPIQGVSGYFKEVFWSRDIHFKRFVELNKKTKIF